jgi:hypothetical protein
MFSRRSSIISAVALIAFVPGCIWPVAMNEPFTAKGTWTGTLEPVLLQQSHTARTVTGIQVRMLDGPPLQDQDSVSQMPVVGFDAILVDTKKHVIPWGYPTSQRRHAAVTGCWSSDNRYALWSGQPVFQPSGPQRVRDRYNVIIVTRIEDEVAITSRSAAKSVKPE